MNNKTYYITNDIDHMGSEPVCCDLAEVKRLNREWGTDMDNWHEASSDEIAEYGVYDSDIDD